MPRTFPRLTNAADNLYPLDKISVLNNTKGKINAVDN